MIDYIKGKIAILENDYVVIENNNIGYKVITSSTSISDFMDVQDEVTVYTQMIVKEDDISLCGFSTRDELKMLQLLTSVNGVGTKVGVGILSSINWNNLIFIIMNGDVNSLTKAQGVGKKTAQRIILELKDKAEKQFDVTSHGGSDIMDSPMSASNSSNSDAVEALLTLGYTRTEINGVIRSLPIEGLSTEEIIKETLKRVGRF